MYSIKQVVDMLDIPSVTLRAWENRYQAVIPERTESGYRLYSDENVEDLRWLKEQTEQQGISISHAVRMLKARKEKQLEDKLLVASGNTPNAFEKMKEQIYDALHEFQGERANVLIDFGLSLYGYEAMFHQVLVPILIHVGDAWEEGTATVAQEHYTTHMISNRFHQIFHVFPVYSHLPKALAFCPAGEHHQVGLLLFALFLRKNGMEVIFLGANTPEEGIISMLEQQSRVGLICMSVTDDALIPYSEELIARLRIVCPEAKFLVGGKGYEKDPSRSKADHVMTEPVEYWQAWFDRLFTSLKGK